MVIEDPDSLMLWYHNQGYPFVKILIDSIREGRYYVRIEPGERVEVMGMGTSNISRKLWRYLPYFFLIKFPFIYSFRDYEYVKRKVSKYFNNFNLSPVLNEEKYIFFISTPEKEQTSLDGYLNYSGKLYGNVRFSLFNGLGLYEKVSLHISFLEEGYDLNFSWRFPFLLSRFYTYGGVEYRDYKNGVTPGFHERAGYYISPLWRAEYGVRFLLGNPLIFSLSSLYVEEDGFPFPFHGEQISFEGETDYRGYHGIRLSGLLNRSYRKFTSIFHLYYHLAKGEEGVFRFGGMEQFPGFPDNSIFEEELVFLSIKMGFNTGYVFLSLFSGYAFGKDNDYLSAMLCFDGWFRGNRIAIYTGYNRNFNDFVIQIGWEVKI